jgi:hypothetical protein
MSPSAKTQGMNDFPLRKTEIRNFIHLFPTTTIATKKQISRGSKQKIIIFFIRWQMAGKWPTNNKIKNFLTVLIFLLKII